MREAVAVKYLVKLNDEYVTEHDDNTGYIEFGDKENALRFSDCNAALLALADVIWGGSDEQHDKAVAAGVSDSQRYKQAGNAISVNIAYAIGLALKGAEND